MTPFLSTVNAIFAESPNIYIEGADDLISTLQRYARPLDQAAHPITYKICKSIVLASHKDDITENDHEFLTTALSLVGFDNFYGGFIQHSFNLKDSDRVNQLAKNIPPLIKISFEHQSLSSLTDFYGQNILSPESTYPSLNLMLAFITSFSQNHEYIKPLALGLKDCLSKECLSLLNNGIFPQYFEQGLIPYNVPDIFDLISCIDLAETLESQINHPSLSNKIDEENTFEYQNSL
ncbi:hypothetical protein HNW13_018570 [Shewanella sp. BF02_Schw]|uniref:hypothetical protein n=1 Tax=Shewanella sp. BF02_Schw TaxID=394908 RepID=UPI0017821A0E|nr:hypothetical protein [Shewanella sp. BF02_Schw]MBO1897746.1 hypothetical protein [Shewanella sp. BF02_Schw]